MNFAAKLKRDISLAADAHEWAQDDVAGVRPQHDAAPDDFELQRADVALSSSCSRALRYCSVSDGLMSIQTGLATFCHRSTG